MPSKPLLPGGCRAAEQERVVGGHDARERHGRVEHLPLASAWTMNGPNSSPNQNVPSGAWRTDSMSKSPPVSMPVGRVLVDDRERDLVVGVAERDRVEDLGRCPGRSRSSTRADLVEAQDEGAAVGLGAEAVVGHRVEVALPASSSAEKPPTGCVEPTAGAGSVLMTPGRAQRTWRRAGRIARTSSLGSAAPAAGATGASEPPKR